ncbi:hypothetical protein BKA60DRAFT_603001 [Fusarium oxysporum]|nr:hypothetical protein BKA60DRAFT_603001 [Fusarium oxysporum]
MYIILVFFPGSWPSSKTSSPLYLLSNDTCLRSILPPPRISLPPFRMFGNGIRQSLRQSIRTVASATSSNTIDIGPSGAVSAVRIFWELNRQIQDANLEPSDDCSGAAQQLLGCSASVGRSPAAAQVHTPALAPPSKVGQMTIEERKVVALEAIAEAARLWVKLNKSNEESKTDEGSGCR